MEEEPRVIKKDEFTKVEHYQARGIIIKTMRYPHGNNNRLHLEREAGNLALAKGKGLPVVSFLASTYYDDDENPWGKLEMDFYNGDTLKSKLSDSNSSPEIRTGYLRRTLEVIDAIDKGGILLFDPNMENFLVHKRTDEIVACDFGLVSSIEYPHRVHPPTEATEDYYSRKQNNALQKSIDGDHTLLNKLTVKDDLYVFARDLRNTLDQKMLPYRTWAVVDGMIAGNYSSAGKAAEALGKTPKPVGLKHVSEVGKPAFAWLKLKPALLLSLGGIILAGGIGLNNHETENNQEEVVQKAISSSMPVAAIATKPQTSQSAEVKSEPQLAEAVIPTYRKEPKPDGSLLLTNIPKAVDKTTVEKKLLQPKEQKTAPTDEKKNARQENERRRLADLKVQENNLKKLKKQKERRQRYIDEKLKNAIKEEKKHNYSKAYHGYRNLKTLGVKDSEQAISRLEGKVQKLIDTEKTREKGYELLKSIADQRGNPKAKLYYGAALLTGQFAEISEKNNTIGLLYVKKAVESGVDPKLVKYFATEINKTDEKISKQLLNVLAEK